MSYLCNKRSAKDENGHFYSANNAIQYFTIMSKDHQFIKLNISHQNRHKNNLTFSVKKVLLKIIRIESNIF